MFEHPQDEPVLHLNEDQSRQLLANTRHGRIGFINEGAVEIFPINFMLDGDSLVFRTAPGTKLDAFQAEQAITFETDGILPDQGWSVVVRGTGRVLSDPEQAAYAAKLGVTPWVPTFKDFFVAMSLDEISGRHFIFGRQPERGDDSPFRHNPQASKQGGSQLPDDPDPTRLSR